jgi:hypothetical protein
VCSIQWLYANPTYWQHLFTLNSLMISPYIGILLMRSVSHDKVHPYL